MREIFVILKSLYFIIYLFVYGNSAGIVKPNPCRFGIYITFGMSDKKNDGSRILSIAIFSKKSEPDLVGLTNRRDNEHSNVCCYANMISLERRKNKLACKVVFKRQHTIQFFAMKP